MVAEAQPHLQLVPGVGVAPLGGLVAPRVVVLRPAELVGFLRRVRRCDDAVRPDEPPLRWVVGRAEPGRGDREDPRVALYHDVAGVGGGFSDQSDPHAATSAARLVDDPLRSDPGFPIPSPREDKPERPVPGWRPLLGARPETPLVLERLLLVLAK